MKTKPFRKILCPAALVAAAIAAVFTGNSQASSFTQGNIVVERLGDGTQTLGTGGNTIFFDEYTPSGTLVQSIAIPDTGVSALIEAGTGATTGGVTLSADGRLLCFPGYVTNRPFSSSLPGATAATVPRGVGTLDGNGVYVQAAKSSSAFSTSNIRGAATDGNTNFWGSGTGTSGGIFYFGTASAAADVFSANLRDEQFINNNLWYSTASTTPGVGLWKFTGAPTTATGNTAVRIIAQDSVTNSPYNFSVSPSETVAYIVDDGSFAAAAKGIYKWTNSGSAWSPAYELVNGTACFGLTVDYTTTPPTLYATTGSGAANNTLIKVQDTGAAATATTLATAGTGKIFRGVAFSPTNGSTTITAPNITGILPSSITTNSGSTVSYTVSATGSPASYFWYFNSTANLIPGAASATLTLNNVLGANSGNYFVVLSNSAGTATSSIVTLSVIDPSIVVEPSSTFGLLKGTVQFAVTAAGTSPGYQWYFATPSGTIVAPVANVTQGSGSVISGATTSLLSISNLQSADLTNFVVVVSNATGSVTSTVASILSASSHAELAFWNFNQTSFPNMLASPAPWFGVGTASPVGSCNLPGTTPFAGSVDPFDGPGFGLGTTNFSWGTDNYPANGANPSNKLNGVQFMVSTVGAQNITVSYDSRVSGTASDYERVQYTMDGSTWIDYPSSSTFGGVGTTYIPFTNNLTGFPGAANNPNFGIRIVTETQDTATYGVSGNANYLGTANTYGTTGTVTYDIVTVWGDAIPQTYAPPTISAIPNTNTQDNIPLTLNFTVSDPSTSPDSLSYSAVSLNPSTVNPPLTFGGSGVNRTLTIGASSTPDNVDAGPILITVTDSKGFSVATWFDLTLTSLNLPPTNTLTAVTATNTLANAPLTVSFKVTDDRTPTNGQNFSYSASSLNNAVIPSGNIAVPSPSQSSNATVTITPANNQLGVGQISVSVADNDLVDPKVTTANIAFMVRPNTNVVMIDYFNYDNGGALDAVASNTWTHLSGTRGQMQVSPLSNGGSVTVDTLDNTENLQAALIGAPYKTNSGGTLYASYEVNMDSTKMPIASGSYFAAMNDGSQNTANVECCVVSATNGAAPGFYRLGIANLVGANATDAQMFPMDLSPNTNYVVVTSLNLSNGFSTIWVAPTSSTSASVTDTTPVGTNVFNIANFELRESGTSAGSLKVSFVKVGTTFDSVFPSLHIQEVGANTVVTWSDPTLGVQSSTNVAGPYVDLPGITSPYTNSSPSTATFYRFGH